MKLAMAKINGTAVPMVLLADGLYLDLAQAAVSGLLEGPPPASVTQILDASTGMLEPVRRVADAAEGGGAVRETLEKVGALRREDQIKLLAPLTPCLILCTGGSYQDHIREMGVEKPEAPGAFIKSLHTVTGPRDPILLPKLAPDMVDFECEFCCVFSRPCFDVSAEEALDYVGGYTMINDVSARDAVPDWFASLTQADPKRSCDLWDANVRGKQFPSFCPMGPVVTTADEIPDPLNVRVETKLNGKVMQSAHTSDLFFGIAEVIAHFSRWYAFAPGDVMSTGSPSGVGYASDPKVLLMPGDVVEVTGEGIGSLINQVVLA